MLKTFKQWKIQARRNHYIRKRAQLSKNFIFSKPQFSQYYGYIMPAINSLKPLEFIELKKNFIYGKKQQSTLDEKCEKILQESSIKIMNILRTVNNNMEELKKEIK